MVITSQKQAAKKFVEYWTFNRPGSEKSGCQQYWNMLLGELLGLGDLASAIRYEVPVQLKGTTKYLDAWIPSTRVLIEQKSRGVKLDAPQPGHNMMTPFEQAKFYDDHRPFDEKARWIVTCNFDEIWIYDQTKPLDPPEKIALGSLPKEVHRLAFLVNAEVKKMERRELEISVQAGKIVGTLYDALLKQYAEPDSPETLKALNKLCVRLVFCLYAEDADIFEKNIFRKLVAATPADRLRRTLVTLFDNLNRPVDRRDPYLEAEIAAFPYTNGGLFSGVTEAEIPPLTEEIKKLLIGSSDFDWSGIDTTIFGALFESTLNPVTRRAGGMVYTSSENIHKLIDPLFLDDLENRFESIAALKTPQTVKERLGELQDHIASLTFLDPACGSGNFLTETYTCLRRLENRIIAKIQKAQPELDLGLRVKVSINQFHGIEINDFAVTVAKTAMWISEAKMLRETAEILHRSPDFLPLKDYAGIVEGNALRMDWNKVRGIAAGKDGIAVTVIDTPVDFRSAKVHLLDLKRNHAVVENADGVKFRFTNQVMKALSDKARNQSSGRAAHWAAVGNIERLCKASVALWKEKPRNGSTDILHYAKHGAAFSFGGGNYVAKITSKAYPGEDGVVTYSVEAISVESNFARGIADAISKKQHLDPSDESRILNFVEAVKGVSKPYSYIIGNPPFVGARNKSPEQAHDVESVFPGWKNVGNLDYVTCWYKKAADYMIAHGRTTRAAFVATNSICQGDGVATLWKPLFGQGVEIDYAWRTFRWDNESFEKAHVHVIIVGFHVCGDKNVAAPAVSLAHGCASAERAAETGTATFLSPRTKVIYDGSLAIPAKHINAYLADAADVFVESRRKPICAGGGELVFGSMPNDGGHLSDWDDERKNAVVEKYPAAAQLFRKLLGSQEAINGISRWCLWLKGVSPSIIRSVPPVLDAVEKVREMRENSKRAATRKLAATPMLFGEIRQPETGSYLLVPSVSSEKRGYVPMCFLDAQIIASNLAFVLPNATLYHFGVLTSSVHMAWMRTVCGRLEMRYRYSAAIVYNNFPWPDCGKKDDKIGQTQFDTRQQIEKAAQGILDARALYPDSSLADLYDPLTMPSELRKAHAVNDAAVLKAYGWPTDLTEPEIVSRLFEMYAKLTNVV